jgi:hypothetical protein
MQIFFGATSTNRSKGGTHPAPPLPPPFQRHQQFRNMPKKKRVSVKYVDHPTSRFDHFMNAFVFLAFTENEEVKSKHRKLVVDKGMQEWRRHKNAYKKMTQEQFDQVLRHYEKQNQLSAHELNGYTQTVPGNANRTQVLNSGAPSFMLPLPAFSMLLHPGSLTPSDSSHFQNEEDECSKKDAEEQSSKSSSSSKKNERSAPIIKPIKSVSQPLLINEANCEGNTWSPFLNSNLAYFLASPQLTSQNNQHQLHSPQNRQADLVSEQAEQVEEHNETGEG